jgi:hypothetical protein
MKKSVRGSCIPNNFINLLGIKTRIIPPKAVNIPLMNNNLENINSNYTTKFVATCGLITRIGYSILLLCKIMGCTK